MLGLKFCSSQNFLANTVRLCPHNFTHPVLRWCRPFLNAALIYENHRFRRLLVRLDLKLGDFEFSVAYLLIKRSGWGLVGSWLGRRSDRADFLLTMGMVGRWLVIFGGVGSWLGMVGIWDHGCWWSDRADFLLTTSIASHALKLAADCSLSLARDCKAVCL